MANHTHDNATVIVVGGSAGALDALRTFVARLPTDFPAAIFVVIHFPPTGTSQLAQILARVSSLPVKSAVDGDEIVPGVIYTAPPNRHLILQRGNVYLTDDAKEHNFRPAIDPLFRSAALSYGKRAIAVVLSGLLDDGTSGAIAVKKRGGQVVVQSPEDAQFSSMPESVLINVTVDASVPALKLAETIFERACHIAPSVGSFTMNGSESMNHLEPTSSPEGGLDGHPFPPGDSTPLTCPSCHGALWRSKEPNGFQLYQCHTGHRFTARTLAVEQSLSLEKSLQNSFRAAKERAFLSKSLAELAAEKNNGELAERFHARAESEAQQASFILAAIHASPFHEMAEASRVVDEQNFELEM